VVYVVDLVVVNLGVSGPVDPFDVVHGLLFLLFVVKESGTSVVCELA
jgi:hypothetical protein